MTLMLVLSPAKSLDYDTPPTVSDYTLPEHIQEAQGLIDVLRPLSPVQVGELMDISDKLAALNVARYESWQPTFTTDNAKQAVLAFNGDVYEGLQAQTLKPADLKFAQKHVRILSGLYGLLRPLDLMQPYRLEMGTRLTNPKGKDLYAYWKGIVAQRLNEELGSAKAVLVNLASDEYFKSVDLKQLKARVVHPVFEDLKSGRYKIISFYAKRARGLMARYAITKRVTRVEQLKDFDLEGYRYDAQASTTDTWVFRRDQVPAPAGKTAAKR